MLLATANSRQARQPRVSPPKPVSTQEGFPTRVAPIASAELLPYKSREPSHLISNPVEFTALETLLVLGECFLEVSWVSNEDVILAACLDGR